MGKESGAAAPTLRVENFDAIEGAINVLGERVHSLAQTLETIDDRLLRVDKTCTDGFSKVERWSERVEAQKARLDQIDAKQDALFERLDRPVTAVFKPDATFYNTMSTRLGEEFRASLDSRIGSLGQQLAAGMDAGVKANMPKPAWGSAIVPIASVVGAVLIGWKCYSDYLAAQAYVPADVRVSVNGTSVPHSTQQSHGAPHAVNGVPRSFARS